MNLKKASSPQEKWMLDKLQDEKSLTNFSWSDQFLEFWETFYPLKIWAGVWGICRFWNENPNYMAKG